MEEAKERTQRNTGKTSIFFSYSRVNQAKALPIIEAIKRAGYKVWWDGMLEGGTSYLETTEEALESANAVVVLWSKDSVKSHWVRDEATSGRVSERLIPLSLDGTDPPLGFRQVQMIDFSHWNGRDDSPCIQELNRVLAVLHGSKPGPRPVIPIVQPRRISRRTLFLSGVGVGVAALGGIAITGKLPFGSRKLLDNGIAVLPFRNLSGDPEQDYISYGLSSELRSSLARNESLRVVARSSSESVAKQSLGAEEIAKQLGVSYILDGNIRVVNGVLKVSTELIDGKTGFSKWVKDFENVTSELLGIQNQIADAVTQALTTEVLNADINTKTGGTENAVAFNEYLKGNNLFRSNISRESNLVALEHYETAIRLDPEFGTAHAAKARLLQWLGGRAVDTESAQNYFNSSVAAARQAVELSPNNPTAHSTLAYILFSAKLDIQGAREPFARSREKGFGSAAVLARYATYMALTDQKDEALIAINRALELDPLNATIHRSAGLVHYAAARYEQAIEATNRVVEINPRFRNTKARIGMSLVNMGEAHKGLDICETETNQMERLPCLAIAQYKLGNEAEANSAMSELISVFGDQGAYQQAQVLAQWGDLDQAMQILDLALELKDSGLSLARIDPTLDPLRGRSDFSTLLANIGFIG